VKNSRLDLPNGIIVQLKKGKYEVLEPIGEGGNACVWKVKYLESGEFWALKVFWPLEKRLGNPKAAKRFLREALILQRVKNDYIVKLKEDECGYLPIEKEEPVIKEGVWNRCADLAINEIENLYSVESKKGFTPYIVIEYCNADLQHLFSKKLDYNTKKDIFIQMCKGVHSLHCFRMHSNENENEYDNDSNEYNKDRLFHRDIKPANILFKKIEGKFLIKVSDFGIAHLNPSLFSIYISTLTLQKEWLANAACASPEQEEADNTNIDYRTDIYSLGVVAYMLFTDGRSPKKKTIELNDLIIDKIIKKMREDEKEDRYQSLQEVIELLEERKTWKVNAESLYQKISRIIKQEQALEPKDIEITQNYFDILRAKYQIHTRTGCATVYMAKIYARYGEIPKAINLYKLAIENYSNSEYRYGDDTLVGAAARYELVCLFLKQGENNEAEKLIDDLHRNFPYAIYHNGHKIAELLQQNFKKQNQLNLLINRQEISSLVSTNDAMEVLKYAERWDSDSENLLLKIQLLSIEDQHYVLRSLATKFGNNSYLDHLLPIISKEKMTPDTIVYLYNLILQKLALVNGIYYKVKFINSITPDLLELLKKTDEKCRIPFYKDIICIMKNNQYGEVNKVTPSIPRIQDAIPLSLQAEYVKALFSQSASNAYQGAPSAIKTLEELPCSFAMAVFKTFDIEYLYWGNDYVKKLISAHRECWPKNKMELFEDYVMMSKDFFRNKYIRY